MEGPPAGFCKLNRCQQRCPRARTKAAALEERERREGGWRKARRLWNEWCRVVDAACRREQGGIVWVRVNADIERVREIAGRREHEGRGDVQGAPNRVRTDFEAPRDPKPGA